MTDQNPNITNRVSFTSDYKCRYGDRFTVLSPPSDKKKHEVMISFGTALEPASVRFKMSGATRSQLTPGSTFVVLRCSTADGKTFCSEAVSTADLERATETIEEAMSRVLLSRSDRHA